VEENIHMNLSLLPLDMGMCVLWVLLLKIFESSSSSSLLFLLGLLLSVHYGTQVPHGLYIHISLELEP